MVAACPVGGLTVLAWANVGLHLAGLALAAVGMRPGSPLVPLLERLRYLAAAPAGWSLGWSTWMLCTIALVAFLVLTAQRLGEWQPAAAGLARLGVVVAVVGAGFDLWCDCIYILVFPQLASAEPTSETLFLTVEQITNIASLVIANGAYSLATLLLTLALRGRQGLAPLTVPVGYGVFGFGLLLAAAGFTGIPQHAMWATPPTIGLFCVWTLLVARSLEAGRAPPVEGG